MVQSQGNQAEVQGYAHYVNLSFNRGNFTHKIGLDQVKSHFIHPFSEFEEITNREALYHHWIENVYDSYNIYEGFSAFRVSL